MMGLSTVVGLDNKFVRSLFVVVLAVLYGPALSLLMNASTSLFQSGYRVIVCFMFTYKYATMAVIQILERFIHMIGSGWYELGLCILDTVLVQFLTLKVRQL